MDKETFQSLSDEALGRACMEPVFGQIRGKSPQLKARVVAELGQGRAALCMFRVMYDHSSPSAAEFYAWISYMQEQPGYWSGVLRGLEFFGDRIMYGFLEETRQTFAAWNLRGGRGWEETSLSDLERDPELRRIAETLYVRFQTVAAESLRIIAAYIREHPQEFVRFGQDDSFPL
ncbi:hypothetical protein ['Paenibacillus yunnanensis' Narsing Rao et al. 2020]|uniref:hypothetical protein n=1 Tax=Paenibacillus tengchongensis TaxID=2608684 RepID=UPI001651BD25|nr:hypothetical protein [Paenibacillus tengchongensis]